jgi:hypothetical protein
MAAERAVFLFRVRAPRPEDRSPRGSVVGGAKATADAWLLREVLAATYNTRLDSTVSGWNCARLSHGKATESTVSEEQKR